MERARALAFSAASAIRACAARASSDAISISSPMWTISSARPPCASWWRSTCRSPRRSCARLLRGQFYSNYHAEIDAAGYYKDCDQYHWILNRHVRGVVEVPVVHCTYLVRADVIPELTYEDATGRHEYVVFSDSARKAGIPQYLDNRQVYGYVTFGEGDEHYVSRRDRAGANALKQRPRRGRIDRQPSHGDLRRGSAICRSILSIWTAAPTAWRHFKSAMRTCAMSFECPPSMAGCSTRRSS